MCTVTVIPLYDTGAELYAAGRGRPRVGCRIVCNRDERRDRPEAMPPIVRRVGGRMVVMPIDPGSGGTWIAMNGTGVAMTLLNVNREPARRSDRPDLNDGGARRSRGEIISMLAGARSSDEAVHAALSLRATEYDPFRLLIINMHGTISVVSDGRSAQYAGAVPIDVPAVFSSSGLGDELVQAPRAALFETMCRDESPTAAQQDAFHAHEWPDRPHLSVRMMRPDARTVSRTTIELLQDRGLMRYQALDEGGAATEDDARVLALEGVAPSRRRRGADAP